MPNNFDVFRKYISYYDVDDQLFHLPEVAAFLDKGRELGMDTLEWMRDKYSHKSKPSKDDKPAEGMNNSVTPKTPPPKPPSLTQSLAENSLFGSNTRIQDVTHPLLPKKKKWWKDPSFDVCDFTIRTTIKNKEGDERWRFWAGDRFKAEYRKEIGENAYSGRLEHNFVNGRTRARYFVSNPSYGYDLTLSRNKDNVWDLSAGYCNTQGFNVGVSYDSEKNWAVGLGYRKNTKSYALDLSAFIGSENSKFDINSQAKGGVCLRIELK